MTCKTTVVVIVGIISCFYPVWAAEREELLEFFEQEYVVTEKEHSEKTKTNVDLVGAAGNYCAVLKKQLFQALDYKLRHTAEASERLRILFRLFCPGNKMVDSTLGTVGIKYFQTVTLCFDIITDRFQSCGSLHGKQCSRLFVTIDPFPDKVIGGKIADFKNCTRHCI